MAMIEDAKRGWIEIALEQSIEIIINLSYQQFDGPPINPAEMSNIPVPIIQ
ncbi:hypothetical protein DOT_3214 [Desulfosporosinus sp. OT]|nr:hypothetical protein DOT_3214 [Desulfosporosinus sp. OT]